MTILQVYCQSFKKQRKQNVKMCFDFILSSSWIERFSTVCIMICFLNLNSGSNILYAPLELVYI